MLKQLLKYEFQATRSYYGTAYLALLASALLLGAGATHMPRIGGADLDALWALMALVYMGTIDRKSTRLNPSHELKSRFQTDA